MRIRILAAVVATTLVAGCSDTSTTTAPRTLRPEARLSDGLVCRSGYHVATRADGTQYCEADPVSTSRPTFKP